MNRIHYILHLGCNAFQQLKELLQAFLTQSGLIT